MEMLETGAKPQETLADRWMQALRAFSLTALMVVAIALTMATLSAAFNLLPWLEAQLTFGQTVIPEGGMYIQIGLTLFALALLSFLPANRRILELQKSHRDFRISMQDVARAYSICHAADRAGTFTMSSEFDAVRERMEFMRRHPDLRGLEPGVLEVAAQMSEVSRDLAEVYSTEKMERARTFLRQRQEEIEAFEDRLATARQLTDEIKRWKSQVAVEESLQTTQLNALERDLLELLPELGFDVEEEAVEPTPPHDAAQEARKVVPMPAPQGKSKGKPQDGSAPQSASQSRGKSRNGDLRQDDPTDRTSAKSITPAE